MEDLGFMCTPRGDCVSAYSAPARWRRRSGVWGNAPEQATRVGGQGAGLPKDTLLPPTDASRSDTRATRSPAAHCLRAAAEHGDTATVVTVTQWCRGRRSMPRVKLPSRKLPSLRRVLSAVAVGNVLEEV
ncbi:unnamed protein product [Boreogadus saida]